jgi:uncharacterized protein
MYRRLVLLVILFSMSVFSLAHAGFEKGKAAYDKGDYVKAYNQFKALAEKGFAGAQYQLGYIYEKGQGVRQDYVEAVVWYRMAAEQGDAVAQKDLGMMYAIGIGVRQDFVQAHMWFDLAAAQGDSSTQEKRDKLAEKMTPAQIAEAQRLAREWRPKSQ